MPILRTLRDGLTPTGLLVAASFFGAALTPSMMPREPIVQATLAAVAATFGYEVTLLARSVWRYLELPEPKGRLWTLWLLAACGISLAIMVYSLSKAASWQNATREAVGLPPLESAAPFFIVTVGVLIALCLWLVFRVAGALRRAVAVVLDKMLPRRVAWSCPSFLLAGSCGHLSMEPLYVMRFVWPIRLFWLQTFCLSLISKNLQIRKKPAVPGRWSNGRRWGVGAVTMSRLLRLQQRFPNSGRIMLLILSGSMFGRRSGDTAEERAQLALQELIRVGGFDRSVLVVVVPPGTGWMDPGAHDTIDFMLGGDVATVAVQYSYLTSFLALLAHPDYGVDQARALFNAVYAHWTQLPKDGRPELYVHGLSQGAFNSQATLPLFDMLGDPIQGAFWAGSPFFSRYWSEVRDRRKADSPAWRPNYGNGSLVRVMDQYGGLEGNYAPWGPIRAVFLNYGSDPS